MREKAKAGELKVVSSTKKRRWDQASAGGDATNGDSSGVKSGDQVSKWHEAATPRAGMSAQDMETPMNRNVWDATPGHADSGATTPPDIGSATGETPRVKNTM